MRLFPDELALAYFLGVDDPEDQARFPREEALEELRRISGEDFGDDVEAWALWVHLRQEERKARWSQTTRWES